jgi:hypothetical protein
MCSTVLRDISLETSRSRTCLSHSTLSLSKRCPKSRQVHARINPLDLNATKGDFTRRGEGEQGLTRKGSGVELEKRAAELYVKNDRQSVFPGPFEPCFVRHFHVSRILETSKRQAISLRGRRAEWDCQNLQRGRLVKTKMNDQSLKRKEGKEPCPGLAPKKDKGKRIRDKTSYLKHEGKGIKDETDLPPLNTSSSAPKG